MTPPGRPKDEYRSAQHEGTIMSPLRRWVAPAAVALFASTALVTGSANATGLDQLRTFVDATKSGKATFRQTVTSKDGRVKESVGTFSFQRPGRFRWSYDKPFDQLIVGDGTRLWIYDRDLNQVIVRAQAAALGSSPAALLAGDNALDRDFALADAGTTDDLALIEAKPKSQDTGFASLRIGFRDNLPRRMELRDAFGNVTTLVFESFERNAHVAPGQFAFVPPPGADVVGDKP